MLDQREFLKAATLSPGEYEVICGLGDGLTVTEIANLKDRSIKTVETQLASARRKLALPGMAKLRVFAARYRVFLSQ